MTDSGRFYPDHLTEKEENFCKFYTAIGSESCGNGAKAAEAALYSCPRNAAWRLLKRPLVKARIAEIHKELMDRCMVSAEGVLLKLEHVRVLAVQKGDLATAKSCIELEGKFLGLFTERLRIEGPFEAADIEEAKKKELGEIARLRCLAESMGLVLPPPTVVGIEDSFELNKLRSKPVDSVVLEDNQEDFDDD